MKEVFIDTQNVTTFRKSLNGLVKRDRRQPGLMVVEGPSGRGKSMAADNWYAVHGGVFFRVWQRMSQHAFLQELAFETCRSRPNGCHNCKRMIIERLREKPQPIIIDEADRLHLDRIEDLRDINDATGSVVVLVGEDGLLSKLREQKRIYSRVAATVSFLDVQPADIIMYGAQFAELVIRPEAAALLATKCDGSFRMVHNHMVQLMEYGQANSLNTIEARHVADLDLRDGQ
jgi:Uncharacterized ATPase, putative transposase